MLNYSFVAKNGPQPDNMGNNNNSYYPDTAVIINCVLNAPLMLISIIGNTLVLAAILRTPSLCSPSTTFLCSLAVTDFLVGLVAQPVYIADALINGAVVPPVYNELISDNSLFQAKNLLAILLCSVSLFTMTTISFDRFLALRYHMRYPNLMTTKRAIYTSISVWIVCILLSVLLFLAFWDEIILMRTISVCIAICLVISLFSYIRIYQVVRHHQFQIKTQQQAVNGLNALNTEQNLNIAQSTKIAINTFIYYVCMLLCYFPFFIRKSIRSDTGLVFADTVVFLNSSINPFLYCWRNRKIRAEVELILKKLLCKQPGEN